jgi:hypothetical protein
MHVTGPDQPQRRDAEPPEQSEHPEE